MVKELKDIVTLRELFDYVTHKLSVQGKLGATKPLPEGGIACNYLDKEGTRCVAGFCLPETDDPKTIKRYQVLSGVVNGCAWTEFPAHIRAIPGADKLLRACQCIHDGCCELETEKDVNAALNFAFRALAFALGAVDGKEALDYILPSFAGFKPIVYKG